MTLTKLALLARDAQRCGLGCCFFIDGEAVSKDDFRVAAPSPTNQTKISCLRTEVAYRVSKEIGFYIGFDVSKPKPIGAFYKYDAVTHRYLRDAHPEEFLQWNITYKKIKEKMMEENSRV
jgi:hypothetical protein